MIDDLLADAKERMKKSVDSTAGEFATVRTGRATPHLLDRISVDYYGAVTPLNQLANVAASEARSHDSYLLLVTPGGAFPQQNLAQLCLRRLGPVEPR